MKRIVLLAITLVLAASWSVSAQGRGGDEKDREKRMEQIEAKKIGFITQSLDLSADQAKDFWPVYNAYSNEMKSIHDERREHRDQMREAMNSESGLSDSEIEASVQHRFKTEQELLDLQVKYHKKFKEVLSMKQVGELYVAEEKFKRMLLEEMKGRGSNDSRGGGGRDGRGPHDGQGLFKGSNGQNGNSNSQLWD